MFFAAETGTLPPDNAIPGFVSMPHQEIANLHHKIFLIILLKNMDMLGNSHSFSYFTELP